MSKPRGDPSCGISSEDVLIPAERHPACRQREARSGFGMERENLAGDGKGKGASGSNREAKSTDAPERGGLLRSSEEGSVMELERRRRVTVVELGQSVRREEPFVQWKAAAFARWHEPYKSRGLRTDVATSNAGVFSRSQTCPGKSQEPGSLDGRMAGTKIPEVLKAHRQGLPWGDYESPGRNDSKRKCGLESEEIRGPSPHPKGEGSMGAEI
jgi:hypothetical protein